MQLMCDRPINSVSQLLFIEPQLLFIEPKCGQTNPKLTLKGFQMNNISIVGNVS